ncbi:MAG: hypothetical protein CSA64_02475 [Arachnia propionica]|nr:MAG: hypothetical protein CSA64_02475 [Arachnia propionica]
MLNGSRGSLPPAPGGQLLIIAADDTKNACFGSRPEVTGRPSCASGGCGTAEKSAGAGIAPEVTGGTAGRTDNGATSGEANPSGRSIGA